MGSSDHAGSDTVREQLLRYAYLRGCQTASHIVGHGHVGTVGFAELVEAFQEGLSRQVAEFERVDRLAEARRNSSAC